jgi:hypothetical protein
LVQPVPRQQSVLFSSGNSSLPEVIVHSKIQPGYANACREAIQSFPGKLTRIIKDGGYRIYFAPDEKEAIQMAPLSDTIQRGVHAQLTIGLGVTTSVSDKNQRVIVFNRKFIRPKMDIQPIVHHEMGHALDFLCQFYNERNVQKAFNADLKNLKKDLLSSKYSEPEKAFLKQFFFQKQEQDRFLGSIIGNKINQGYVFRETIADLIALNTAGKGTYGSSTMNDIAESLLKRKMIRIVKSTSISNKYRIQNQEFEAFKVDNPQLFKQVFPTLNTILASRLKNPEQLKIKFDWKVFLLDISPYI